MGFDSDFRQELEFQNLLLFGFLQMMKDKEIPERSKSAAQSDEPDGASGREAQSEKLNKARSPGTATGTKNKPDGERPMSKTSYRVRPTSGTIQNEASSSGIVSKKRSPSASSVASSARSTSSTSESAVNKSIRN